MAVPLAEGCSPRAPRLPVPHASFPLLPSHVEGGLPCHRHRGSKGTRNLLATQRLPAMQTQKEDAICHTPEPPLPSCCQRSDAEVTEPATDLGLSCALRGLG